MTHLANSKIGVRECCIISVTTMRVAGSLAILLDVAQSSTFPTSIRFCSVFSIINFVYAPFKSIMMAGCTSGDLYHLRESS